MATGGKMKSRWTTAKKWLSSIRANSNQTDENGIEAGSETCALVIGKPPENLQSLLQEIGFTSTLVSSATEAAQTACNPPIEIVLLVVQESELDYSQILISIGEQKELSSLPVVAVTALNHLKSLTTCMQAGVDDFYLLPFYKTLLKTRLNNALTLKKISQSHDQLIARIEEERKSMDDLMLAVAPIGQSMTGESDSNRLLETIITQAMNICNADAGTIYMRTEFDTLKFEVLHNHSLKLKQGGSSGNPINLPDIPLHDRETGKPDTHHVVTRVVHTGKLVNIPLIDSDPESELAGPRRFDQKLEYRSLSFLAVPLKNTTNEVSGVLQLINAKHTLTNKIIAFDPALEEVILSLASLATFSLDTHEREETLRQQIT